MRSATLGPQRYAPLAGLAGVTALAWLYLFTISGEMPPPGPGTDTAGLRPWQATDIGLTFVMWAVMMVAMMLPGAAPTILLYATVSSRQRERGGRGGSMPLFTLGYVLVWTAFSVGATLLQWLLHESAVAMPGGMRVSPLLAGVILLMGGVYQLTPFKRSCLKHCRNPLDFVLTRWRKGPTGALLMGLEHGAFCLGCCWAVMLLLFVGGVMNLLWVAAIAAFVLLEKTVPFGTTATTGTGILLLLAGAYVIVQA